MDARRAASVTPEPAAERLRRAGLRATRPRVAALRLIEREGGHWSADDLTAALAAEGERISRASAYNVLTTLERRGLLAHAETGPGRALYERTDHDGHDHFVCRECGKVLDVPRSGPVQRLPGLPGAVVEEIQVVFRGRCPDCF